MPNPLLHAKFHLHQFNVLPLRGEKPQNRPLPVKIDRWKDRWKKKIDGKITWKIEE